MEILNLIDKSGRKRPSYYGLKTLIAQVKGFTSVETIVSGSSSGQYKFILPGKSVNVLWGTGSLPTELTGKVVVVSVDSTQATKDASAITLSSDPIFVFVPD